MGDRYNIHKDEAERARYRAEVPWRWRVFAYVRAVTIIAAPIVVGLALGWWLTRR